MVTMALPFAKILITLFGLWILGVAKVIGDTRKYYMLSVLTILLIEQMGMVLNLFRFSTCYLGYVLSDLNI